MKRCIHILLMGLLMGGCMFGEDKKGHNVVKCGTFPNMEMVSLDLLPITHSWSDNPRSISRACFWEDGCSVAYPFAYVASFVVDAVIDIPKIVYASLTYPFAKEPDYAFDISEASR